MLDLFRFETRLAGAALAALTTFAAAAAEPSRPFKASLEATHSIGRLTRCPGVDGQPGPGATFTAAGRATHLGAVQMHSDHCIILTRESPGTPVHVLDGRMYWVAANGDLLHAHYAGVFTADAQGVYTFEGSYYVTGGTGRFSDAGGTGALSGTLHGDFPVQSQSLTLSVRGRLSY